MRRDGSLLLMGSTDSPDFPATPGALQTEPGGKADMLVLALRPAAGAGPGSR